MSPNDFIILVFGLIFILYYLKNKENFYPIKSLGRQVNILNSDSDFGMENTPMENQDLIKHMYSVLENEKNIRNNGVTDYQNESFNSININNYYNTEKDTPYDLERHDYKFEKNPKKVIAEMEESGEPLELRNVFNKTVKDYKQIERVNPVDTRNNRVDINNFANLDGNSYPLNFDNNEISAINSCQGSFCKY